MAATPRSLRAVSDRPTARPSWSARVVTESRCCVPTPWTLRRRATIAARLGLSPSASTRSITTRRTKGLRQAIARELGERVLHEGGAAAQDLAGVAADGELLALQAVAVLATQLEARQPDQPSSERGPGLARFRGGGRERPAHALDVLRFEGD